MLDKKFQQYKKQGRYKDFNSFEDFFQYVSQVSKKTVSSNEQLKGPKRERGEQLGKLIKDDPTTKDFFLNQEAWRSGEKVEKSWVESYIKKAVLKIAEEKYKQNADN